MPFNVYIGNLASLDDDTMNNVATILQSYFSRISNSANSFGSILVVDRALSLTDSDLLCYLVTDFINSVVVSFDSRIQRGTAGNTIFHTHPTIAASEVYISNITEYGANRPAAIANLIFHELMHNKGTIGERLHRVGGGGLAASVLTSASSLSEGNIRFMQGCLSRNVRQWTAGFEANDW